MDYSTIKALHIIFVVTWFSGLFYIVRLFIYHVEALEKEDSEKNVLTRQFKIMEKRLWYGITWPSAILTLIFASWLLFLNPSWLKEGWMHIKLSFVFLLYLYHLYSHKLFLDIQKDKLTLSSGKLRIYNEAATIFLVAIVFLVVLKSQTDWIWGLGGLSVFAILLMLAIKLYKKLSN
ncbi:MAG TPA: CopD family protein [Bacteroidetes bacterium]|nr:CopD family protein [Bacteroidota bacterium]